MKAEIINDIPKCVQFNTPITPNHEFYTDFKNFRGDFEENVVYRQLNFDTRNRFFDYERYSDIKKFIFFVGMRGSGKTTELFKYQEILDNEQGFFTIFCSIDQELDINDLEYMDIVIFQLEKLISRLKDDNIKVKDSIIESMSDWFEDRIKEINKSIKTSAGIELEIEAGVKTPILKLFGLVGKLKSSIIGTKENAEIIRKTFRYRFNDFSLKFNEFIESVNEKIRKDKKGNEILFIIDGLEKTLTNEIRRKIILDETNRIKLIKAYTIFTLPMELISERNRLRQYGFEFITFPFIKIEDAIGNKIEKAYDKLEEFILKRVDKQLFESEYVIESIIKYSGGSPREILRIINYAWYNLAPDDTQITISALNKALKKLANEMALFINDKKIEKIREIQKLNKQNKPVLYDSLIQEMLEENIVMEYNDGTLKKINPILTLSDYYKNYV